MSATEDLDKEPADSVHGSDTVTGDELDNDERYAGYREAAVKVRAFPQTPGVYLMKNAAGVVIYIGKAVQLRSRASSYFLKAAREDARTSNWVHEIHDIDYLQCDSEVDALLTEARLIKDIQPRHNKDL